MTTTFKIQFAISTFITFVLGIAAGIYAAAVFLASFMPEVIR